MPKTSLVFLMKQHSLALSSLGIVQAKGDLTRPGSHLVEQLWLGRGADPGDCFHLSTASCFGETKNSSNKNGKNGLNQTEAYPPNLTANMSNRVCNSLALMQCLASHPETRRPFLQLGCSGFRSSIRKTYHC